MATKSNSKISSKMSKGKIAGVVGAVGAVAAASLGAYFFYQTPKGKKKVDAIKAGIESWAHKAKHDIVANVKKLKDVNKETYHEVVDTILAKYQKIKKLAPKDIASTSSDLKKYWKYVQKEIHKIKQSVTKNPVKPRAKTSSK